MARHTRRQVEPPIDLFDYQQDRPVARRRAKPSDGPICVTDNWPVTVTVGAHGAQVHRHPRR